MCSTAATPYSPSPASLVSFVVDKTEGNLRYSLSGVTHFCLPPGTWSSPIKLGCPASPRDPTEILSKWHHSPCFLLYCVEIPVHQASSGSLYHLSGFHICVFREGSAYITLTDLELSKEPRLALNSGSSCFGFPSVVDTCYLVPTPSLIHFFHLVSAGRYFRRLGKSTFVFGSGFR